MNPILQDVLLLVSAAGGAGIGIALTVYYIRHKSKKQLENFQESFGELADMEAED